MTPSIVYLDNAATSHPKPPSVLEAVVDYHVRLPASAGRGAYREAREAGEMLLELRRRFAALIGAPEAPERVVFGLNGTDALNLAIKGVVRPGDHVVATRMDHNSVLRPLHALRNAGVATVDFADADDDGFVRPESIEALLKPTTRLVVLPHATNVSGTLQDATTVGALAKARGALFLLDAAQTAGCVPIDVEAMRVDLLACPGHKALLGPQGTGLLWMRPGVDVAPLREGGTGSRSDSPRQPDFLPDRLEPGAHNGPGLAGLAAALRFVESAGVARIEARKRELSRRLVDGLRALPSARLLGPTDPSRRISVVSVAFDGVTPERLASALDERYAIKARAGFHCAPFAHERFGTTSQGGAVRFSPGPFTSDAELDRLFNGLRALLPELRRADREDAAAS
jgi:cysteine desulfurase / selenocysteine lyase